MEPRYEDRFRSLACLVGNTPLFGIRYRWNGSEGVVWAKAEQINLTGSIKDRMALYILRRASMEGTLKPDSRIAEVSSGNSGISFASIGRALGHRVTILIPDWMSRERIDLIRSFGAEVRLISKQQGGFIGAIEIAEQLARKEPGWFLPHQFSNVDNLRAHELTTGPEISIQLGRQGLKVDAFVAGVGTGGTVMGVGRALKRSNLAVRLHPVEPASSPTLSTGSCSGTHRIQGISDEFIPPIVDLSELDTVIAIADGDAILMAQKLATQIGIGVGISAGANLLAAIKIKAELGGHATVVTVLPDDSKKYLSTALMKEEPVLADYLTPQVELLDYRCLPRACETCFSSALGGTGTPLGSVDFG